MTTNRRRALSAISFGIVVTLGAFAGGVFLHADPFVRIYAALLSGICGGLWLASEDAWLTQLRTPYTGSIGGAIITCASIPLWYHFAPAGGASIDFYSTVAQVLPVFFLALVVDANARGRVSGTTIIYAVLATVSGEAVALNSVATGQSDRASYVGVTSSLTFLLAALIITILVEAEPHRRAGASGEDTQSP